MIRTRGGEARTIARQRVAGHLNGACGVAELLYFRPEQTPKRSASASKPDTWHSELAHRLSRRHGSVRFVTACFKTD